MSGPDSRPMPGRDVLLMGTCLCDALADDVARATVEVLEAAGCKVSFPDGQTCCGQPAFNAGDWAAARAVFGHALEVFDDVRPVVTPSASCAAMLRHGGGLAFEGRPEAPAVRALAARTWELGDYLVHGLGITSWPGRYAKKVVLHDSCHGRGTGSPAAGRRLLDAIDGLERVEVDEPEQCCGFGGAFSVGFPVISTRIGQRKQACLGGSGADEVVSADAGCLTQLAGLGSAPRFRHLAQVLRDALDGGPK